MSFALEILTLLQSLSLFHLHGIRPKKKYSKPNWNILMLSWMLNFNNFPLTKSYTTIHTLLCIQIHGHWNVRTYTYAQAPILELFRIWLFYVCQLLSVVFRSNLYIHFLNVRKWVGKCSQRDVARGIKSTKIYFMGNFRWKLYAIAVAKFLWKSWHYTHKIQCVKCVKGRESLSMCNQKSGEKFENHFYHYESNDCLVKLENDTFEKRQWPTDVNFLQHSI